MLFWPSFGLYVLCLLIAGSSSVSFRVLQHRACGMSGWSPQVVIDLESYWAKTCVKLKFPVRQGSIEHFALIRVEHRVLCSDTRDSGTEQDLPETFRQGVYLSIWDLVESWWSLGITMAKQKLNRRLKSFQSNPTRLVPARSFEIHRNKQDLPKSRTSEFLCCSTTTVTNAQSVPSSWIGCVCVCVSKH